jgi:hypothetical protein
MNAMVFSHRRLMPLRMEVGMSKLWEAIKDLERERDRTSESRAATEGNPGALAAYLDEIRLRQRDPEEVVVETRKQL